MLFARAGVIRASGGDETRVKVVSADKFAGVVLAAKNGGAVFKKAYGLSDKSTGTPNRIETKFNPASMNKMFTSVAVA